MLKQYFGGKTVLVTGHTGFKGTWLCAWLLSLGARVVGLGLDPSTSPSHFELLALDRSLSDNRIDIRDVEKVEVFVRSLRPDYVFHLAAQAIVSESYESPRYTWDVNVMGTISLLESLRVLENPCSVVIVTSDKCYENLEWCWGYKETDRLGGADPYSASKAAVELLCSCYARSYFATEGTGVRLVTARAGNVIGGGDWSVGRIVPDSIRSWTAGSALNVRAANSTRPWQHVLEPLSGYLTLAIAVGSGAIDSGESFNFGPVDTQNSTVGDLVREIGKNLEHFSFVENLELNQLPKESGLLKLDCNKARHMLGWEPVLHFEETVKLTTDWYKSYYRGRGDSFDVTYRQIAIYSELASSRGIIWT